MNRAKLFVAALIRYCVDVVQRGNYKAAQRRFAARFCSHGIVDTGWCEECERQGKG